MLKEIMTGIILLSTPVSPNNHIEQAFYNFPKTELKMEQETEILLTWERKIVEATAYNESEEDCDKQDTDPSYGVTASGSYVMPYRTIAASDEIPFGTVYYIPYFKNINDTGFRTVEDRGGAITTGHIDIYIRSRQEGLNFGRRNIEVYVPHGGSFLSNRKYILSRRLQSLTEQLQALKDELQSRR